MEWKYTKENPLRVFTGFAGYDSQIMAIRNIGVPYICVGWSEIDTYAIRAHNAIFPELCDLNYGDISKIDWENVPDFDLFTYSFPCTDISNAGKQGGAHGRERDTIIVALGVPQGHNRQTAKVSPYGECQGTHK